MADPVKISDLPVASNVVAGDILPVVDSALTQTRRCTAGQIAAIGGGPPGNNTVETTHIRDGAVTAVKVGFTAPDRLITRTAVGAGSGVEIPCTSYARGLLATSNSAGALSYLGGLQSSESPTFTGTATFTGAVNVTGALSANGGINGQVRAAGGSGAAPSYSFSGDTDTGIFSPAANNLSITTNGVERLRIDGTGFMSSPLVNGNTLYPFFGLRAYAHARLSGSTWVITGGGISSITYGARGRHHVNFFPQMPDGNYTVMLTSHTITDESNTRLVCTAINSEAFAPTLGPDRFLACFDKVFNLGGVIDPLAWFVMVAR